MDRLVEKAYYTIGQILRCLLIKLKLEQSKWVELFPFVDFAINASMQYSSGLSPQKLVFGQALHSPVYLVEGLHLIEAAQSWVSKVQDVVK